ncbi:hypothetical protein P730_19375 [Salmonella enterica subsp. enterica serovar Enteritidis str. SHSE004]|uniref:hypothetical protein n=1 Tax=Salmonella enterica TaxID=28901 RepID=UPI000B9198E1|nr:hypothetical protein [Salmonella enterica]OXY50506.1 hypothetical protein P730_19375 [Salmonella enterica subsp. enterica serovar Enteritidis str. SHSE004]
MMNFPLNLAVGAAQPVSQVGNYVYYKAGSAGGADPSIKVKTDLGDEYILMPGQGFRLDKRTFTNLQVTNAAGQATIIGMLLIADGGFFDNRTTGSVEVVDGGKARTLAGSAFVGYGFQGGSAGNISQVMLWNNGNGLKSLFVEQISIFVGNTAVQGIGMRSASASIGGTMVTAKSKKLGSTDSTTAEIRYISGALGGTVADTMMNLTQGTSIFKCSEPIVIPPGKGLLLFNGVANDSLGVNFEFFEEVV